MTAVYKAISGVMADLSKIGISKDKKNQQQGFMYRGVDDVMNQLAALLPKHGLVVLPRVIKRETVERQSAQGKALFYIWLDVEYDFVAVEDGSKHVVGPVIGEAMDSGDKASNKALSIAYKYACFQAFCIPTEAVDPDSETHELKPQHPEDKLIGFGKHKDSKWRDVNFDYLDWLANKAEKAPEGAKDLATREIERRDRVRTEQSGVPS